MVTVSDINTPTLLETSITMLALPLIFSGMLTWIVAEPSPSYFDRVTHDLSSFTVAFQLRLVEMSKEAWLPLAG